MAWENIQQVPCWIPQTMLTDPQAFVYDFYNTADDLDTLLTRYAGPSFNGVDPSQYVDNVVVAGDPNTNYKIVGNTREGTPSLYQCKAYNLSGDYMQEFFKTTHYPVSFIAIANRDAEHGMFIVIEQRNGHVEAVGGTVPPYFSEAFFVDIYRVVVAYPYVQGNWKSWPDVTGKNGTFNFTTLYDAEINDFSPMTNISASKFSAIEEQTEAWHLLSGIPYMQEIYPIYAGKVDHMGIRYGLAGVDPDEYIIVTVEFYTSAALPFYTKQISVSKSSPEPLYLSFIVDDERQVARFSFVKKSAGAYNLDFSSGDSAQLYTWLHSHSDSDDVNGPEPDGQADPWNDVGITGLTKPTASAIDTGFTSMYKVGTTELKELAQFLWSNDFVENVKKFFADPREIIVGLSIMPVDPEVGSSKEIAAGGISTGVYGLPLTSQYLLDDDMGSINIKEAKEAKFLNFPPNTRIIAHLPYVGDHELNVHDVMGKTLTLTYLYDFLNGCCVAEICASGGGTNHRYFFSGACAVQIPTSSEDFSRQYSSILSSGVAFGSALAAPFTGGLTAPIAIGAAGNTLNNGMAMSPNTEYSSGGGAITGFLSSQTAYLIVETPNEKIAGNQKNFIGRPSFMKAALSDASGYVKCYDAHIKNIPCTGKEKDEIEANLKAGVLIEAGSPTPTVTPVVAGNTVLAFMNMKSENNVIGKTWNRGTDEDAILKIEGKQIFDQSILTPKFLISGDLRGYNYCYIALFGRYYYITDLVAKSGNLMEVSLKCDPLQSFKTEILNCETIIERASSSSLINSYFNDGQYWTQANKKVSYIPFLNKHNEELTLPRNANSYILTIAGGD